MPKRIQRRRMKGWRMPEGAVYVGKPTKFGNGFMLNKMTRPHAINLFAAKCAMNAEFRNTVKKELRGKDLACWCPLDQPCHADVLIEIANSLGDS